MEDYKSDRRFYAKVALLVPVIVVIIFAAIPNPVFAGEANLLKITDLRCEYLSDLQSLDHQSPNFEAEDLVLIKDMEPDYQSSLLRKEIALDKSVKADIAYKLLIQRTYPGWGDMTKGRTTVSETWKGTGTNNHGGLGGTPNPWIFKTLLGINADPENPGFKRIIINPYIPDDMNYAKGSTRTIKGLVESSWKKDNDKVILKVSIPANTTALVCLPIAAPSQVKEGNNEAGMSQGVSYLGIENNKVNYEIASGQYRFIFDGVNKN